MGLHEIKFHKLENGVCEMEKFGLKFGFFESVLKTRYKGILNCLNIKASISQKKFFLTTLQNFSYFFFQNEEVRIESQLYQRL